MKGKKWKYIEREKEENKEDEERKKRVMIDREERIKYTEIER